MKRYTPLFGAFALGFFLVGIGWGVWSHKKKAEELAHSRPLRILCGEKWLSTAVLERFSREHSVRIQQWTYNRPSEFLRQMANADGDVDVICTSSLLVKSLVRSHWLKKMDYQNLPNMKIIGVDFGHLPFDQNAEYVVPAFWNLYGFFGKSDGNPPTTWKSIWQDKRIALWGEELNVLQLTNRLGVNIEQRTEEEPTSKISRAIDDDIHRFVKSGTNFIQPDSDALYLEKLLAKSTWVEVPLARVAKVLAENSQYKFVLPEDGGMVEVGVFAVGEKSTRPELAAQLINELIDRDEALAIHQRMGGGVLNSALSELPTIYPMERAEALRQFPLNRLKFPDLNVEVLPYFEKIFTETVTK